MLRHRTSPRATGARSELANDAVGHKATSRRHLDYVRFTPESGQTRSVSRCPLSARTDRVRCSENTWVAHPNMSVRAVSGTASAPTVLIMNSPGRLAHARRDRDRAGSGGKRPRDPEAKKVDPLDGGVPAAVRRAEVVWSDVPGTAADDAGVTVAA